MRVRLGGVPSIQIIVPAIYPNALPLNISPSSSPLVTLPYRLASNQACFTSDSMICRRSAPSSPRPKMPPKSSQFGL